ncbi:protein of unknown function [Streptococcus thermophilus]|nr:protein of unknown function [Streptococcus thermophilus]
MTALGREGSSPSFRRVTSLLTGFFILKKSKRLQIIEKLVF